MTAIPPQLDAQDVRPHNWPPLPKFISIEPCFYQDIDVEIPAPFQNTVRFIYNVFQIYVLALLANCISTFCFTFWAGGPLGNLFLVFIQMALFSPCSFLFWFRPVYKAFRSDSSFNFMVFFFVLFFHCIYTVLQTIGFSSSSTGWVSSLNAYNQHPYVAMLMIITSAIFTVALAGMIYSLILVHRLYRGNDNFSLNNARQEFTNGVMSDKNVQGAATAATRAAASNLIQQTVKSTRYEPPKNTTEYQPTTTNGDSSLLEEIVVDEVIKLDILVTTSSPIPLATGICNPRKNRRVPLSAVSAAQATCPLEMVICTRSSEHLVKRRKIMDELLLASHLRRVDDEEGASEAEMPPAKSQECHIIVEKPTTPYVVLPNEPRFRKLLKKNRYALDIGGTLVKLVYSSVVHCDDDYEVLLNFKKFMSIDDCIIFIKENWIDRKPNDVIHCTGGGSFKHAQHLSEVLSVEVKRTDEMHSLIYGCDFLLENNEDESFTYHHDAHGVERFQYKPTSKESLYPFLLVNIGTGISVLKVDSPNTFQRVGGSSMGGGAFIGLGSLLTPAKDFDELLLLAERGDHRRCDTLVSDIYGGDYDCMGLSADLIAGSFGKCNRLDPKRTAEGPSGADIAKSLLLMISNNIGQMAMLYGHRFQMKRIYFGGFFIRKHPITMRTLTYAINFWSKGEVQALFMKHEGYLGAVGAFLDE